jgi:DNA topoisomerase 2-associated protein PAT1
MQMQNMLRGSQQQQQHMQAPQMIHQQQQHPDHLRGIPTPVGPVGGARLPPHEQLQEPRTAYGMAPHVPASQLQNMSEIERARFLEDERKRLKRNHKIAQLARYNGLMTPNDKNFITRIQLQQLVSINNADDAANEDFYYIVHSAIRARANPTQPLNQFAQTYLYRQGRGNRRQDNHLHRMEQQVQRAVAAAKARPKASQLVLEGSLGKISFSNVKTPRPMLNIKKSETGVGEQIRKVYNRSFPITPSDNLC